MARTVIRILTLAAIGLAGCQTQDQVLDNEQGLATQVALKRGRFELGCPTAQATVLSRNMLQPVLWNGIERSEYTVGVAGCGKRLTYIAVCQIGSPSCLAVASRGDAPLQ